MEAGRRHETLGPEVKDFIIHQIESSVAFLFTSDPSCFPSLMGQSEAVQVDVVKAVGLHHSWGPLTLESLNLL